MTCTRHRHRAYYRCIYRQSEVEFNSLNFFKRAGREYYNICACIRRQTTIIFIFLFDFYLNFAKYRPLSDSCTENE